MGSCPERRVTGDGVQGVDQGDEGAGDGKRACAAVSVEDVAINR